MKKKILINFILVSFIILFNLTSEQFYFSADKVRSIFAKGKERTLLSGNARVVSEKNIIFANEIEIFGEKNNYLECRGKVKLINTERGLEITCDELIYERDLKIARIKGNAIMVDRKNEVVVKGGFIESREKEELVIIQIGVRILKENMSCRAEFAKYFRDQDLLELSGMPVVWWKGDQYKAQKIIIDLENDEVKLENNVEGEITSENEQQNPEKKSNIDTNLKNKTN